MAPLRSKAVWNFSEDSFVLEGVSVPKGGSDVTKILLHGKELNIALTGDVS